jgi:hypothetical protein
MKEVIYKVTVKHAWGYVDGDYRKVDSSQTYTYNNWDDVQNLIGYLCEGCGDVDLNIRTVAKAKEA